MAEESNERYPALRLGRLHQLQAVNLHAFVVQDPPSSRDDSILFQKAPYLHSTVHLSCRMVSEDGRNYKFSPISAAKSPRHYRNGVDNELLSFDLQAESLAIYHQRQVDIMITMPKP